MMTKHIAILCVCLLVLAACTEEKPQEPGGTVKTVSPGLSPEVILRPSQPTKDSTIAADVKNTIGQNIEVQWLVNDEMSSQENTYTFLPNKLNKGDIVQAKVLYNAKEYLSNRVIINNTPPVIKIVNILPEHPKCNDNLEADVTATDRDRDNVTYSYRWFVNEKPKGQLSYLEGHFKRDDLISVEVTPFDVEDSGETVIAQTVITNSPPEVNSELQQNESYQNELYKVQVTATDPDGDTLTYSIMEGPEGIEVDSTGLITWKAGPDKAGKYDFTVLIKDSRGAEARLPVSIEIGYKLIQDKKEG
jgi:hypothetical protein